MSERLVTSEERIRELIDNEGIHVSVHRILLGDVLDRLERAEESLRLIASCESHVDGDVVSIAQNYFKSE